MLIWLIIVVIMLVSLTVLALLHKSKVSAIEKFQNTSGVLGSNTAAPTMSGFLASISGGSTTAQSLKSITTTFADGQANYLNNILGKEVLTNAVMPNYTNAMNPAVNQPDVYLNTPENIIVRNLETDNASQFTNADIQWCRSAAMPANLPPHIRGAAVGCGWYYVPDPKLSSSGALGQANGPIFPKGPNEDGVNGIPNYGNGQWIWDLSIAQQLEEIKNCARIKSCIAIDAPSVNGICGFCPPSGLAIPVNVDGTEKYTKVAKIGNISAPAAVCNTPTIMKSASCPVPPGKEKPIVTPQGINCGTLGYPSSDYSIRLYKQDECTEKMNGIWVPNGECLIMGGNGKANGSYSAACAELNGVKPASPEPTVCTPDVNGKISTACLVTLAKSLGYTQQGAIIKILQTKAELSTLDKVAIQIVNGQNVPVLPELYKGGVITVDNAIKGYDKLYSLIKGGTDLITQQAAAWLCIGTNNFDPCNLPDNTPGPFIDQCVQQQWRIAGCQPAGTEYPSDPSVLNGLNTLTWGKVKEIFANTYKAMSSETDPVKQDISVLRCLGINTKRSTPPPCVGVSREGLVINVDSAAFENPDAKAAYTMKGTWTSVNGVYRGDLVASGTKVCDKKGVQFDGTTVLGTPNLIAQVLGLPLSTRILNGPDKSTVTSPLPPTKPSPILQTWFLPMADIGMGINCYEQNSPAPFFGLNIDRAGWQPVFQQLHRDLANGVKYEATVTGNTSGIKYTFMVTQCADGSSWAGWFGNPNVTKTSSVIFGQDSALQFTITKFVLPEFDATLPIMTVSGPLKDIGYPGGGLGISGDQSTYFCVAGTALVQWQWELTNGDILKYLELMTKTANGDNPKSITITMASNNGAIFTAPMTDAGWGGWFVNICGRGASPVNPYGPYYVRQNNGMNLPQFEAWNRASSATMTVKLAGGSINETRELWINPNVDTCEILAVLSGPTYSTSYTVMALFKGQLVIALDSNEKGYTFFNAGKIPIGQFSHIVHVYKDNGINEIYINGAGPVAPPEKLTRVDYNGYFGYSLGGGSKKNPLYQQTPREMPFQGEIGAFRVYNIAFGIKDVQNNLASTIDTYVNQVEIATKNDPNALAMAAGKFYVPSLAPSINYQPNPAST